jgi:hypothetical protein
MSEDLADPGCPSTNETVSGLSAPLTPLRLVLLRRQLANGFIELGNDAQGSSLIIVLL